MSSSVGSCSSEEGGPSSKLIRVTVIRTLRIIIRNCTNLLLICCIFRSLALSDLTSDLGVFDQISCSGSFVPVAISLCSGITPSIRARTFRRYTIQVIHRALFVYYTRCRSHICVVCFFSFDHVWKWVKGLTQDSEHQCYRSDLKMARMSVVFLLRFVDQIQNRKV